MGINSVIFNLIFIHIDQTFGKNNINKRNEQKQTTLQGDRRISSFDLFLIVWERNQTDYYSKFFYINCIVGKNNSNKKNKVKRTILQLKTNYNNLTHKKIKFEYKLN